jgi:antitoxin PrlF
MSMSCQGCSVDSVVTIDSKGQIVLPKELRNKAGLKTNDKLVIVTFEKQDEISCILMIDAKKLGDMFNETIGSMVKDIFK